MSLDRRLDPQLAAELARMDEPFPELSTLTADALADLRTQWAAEPAALRSDPRVTIEDRVVPGRPGSDGVPVRLFHPAPTTGSAPEPPLAALLWIHGGGLVVGSARSDASPVSYTAEAGCLTVSVEYRLAPEHPYPAQLDDCYAALVWLHEHADELGVDPDRVAIGGGSAGGGLAAATALLARDRGNLPLAYQLLVAPMLDDRNDTPSCREFDDPALGWTRSSNRYAWRALLGAAAGTDQVPAYAAPARAADLSGLPPTYLCVGELEVFRDECLDYARRLMQAGVSTELHVYPGAFHGWEFFPDAPISRRSARERIKALRRALRPRTAVPT